jgi:hypothetical protein
MIISGNNVILSSQFNLLMKRRVFVKSTSIAATASMIFPAISDAKNINVKSANSEFYELRIYELKNGNQLKIVEEYLENAAIPALNRHGIKPIGVFTELQPIGQAKIFVLIPYNSISQFNDVEQQLENDTEYKTGADVYLNAPADIPAYERIQSSLLRAFKNMPHLTVPPRKDRIFELRQYQSASEAASKKKIEMFNDEGEIDIFKRLGFNPVFWGETIIGPLRPNLTYMITFDDLEAKAAHWKAFGDDPEWKKISTVPGYADALLVNKITSVLLKPARYSQI